MTDQAILPAKEASEPTHKAHKGKSNGDAFRAGCWVRRFRVGWLGACEACGKSHCLQLESAVSTGQR